jgi:Flp pilus assembly pilin Flp
MINILRKASFDDRAQDIAEYAVMLAMILVIVVGTIRLVGTNANNVFSSAASSVQLIWVCFHVRGRPFHLRRYRQAK